MKINLLGILLFFPLTLSAQPALTLDYYIQDGFHEYNLVLLDNIELSKNGENTIWDFSMGKVEKPSKSYSLDTLTDNYKEYHPELASVDRRLSEIISHQVKYHYLDFDQKITSIAEGFIDYDILADISNIYFDPTIIFPEGLAYGESLIDTLVYQGYTFPNNVRQLDTLQEITTFYYSSYGQFIHPNKDTFCDVIKVTILKEPHFGDSYEKSIWYSKEARGILAEAQNYYNGDLEQGLERVRVKNMDIVNISDNILSADTLIINHSLQNCGIQLSLFSANNCTPTNDFDIVLIDYFNDGTIDDTSYLETTNPIHPSFAIGMHRLIFQQSTTSNLVEKIILIADIQPPEIQNFNFGGGNPFYISNHGATFTEKDLVTFSISDNNCKDTLTYRFWFPETGLPFPDTLTIEEILNLLPSSYYFECNPNSREHWTHGIVYVFDQAGNWASNYFDLMINSRNCNPDCPIVQTTQLSFQNIHNEPIELIQNGGFKKLVYENGFYQFRICPNDSEQAYFKATSFQNMTSITNGVSAFDLLLIRKHILGITPFTTFQQFAAADVNFSGTVTAFDLLLIKEAILGTRQLFPNSTNWVFYEKEIGLLDKHPNIEVFPEQLLEEKRFALKDTTYYFLGIKLGDVNR